MVNEVVKKQVPYTTTRCARGAYVDAKDAGKKDAQGHDCDAPGRVFKEGAVVRTTSTTTTCRMVQEQHTKKVQYTVWENVKEDCVKKVAYQVCRNVPVQVTKQVPETVCEMQKYTVTKRVPYTECVQQAYTVHCRVPYTVQKTVPCTVARKHAGRSGGSGGGAR